MKFLANLIYIIKFALLGGVAGFVVLFFIPNSPMSFNWSEAQNAWDFYQQQSNKPPTVATITKQEFSFADAVQKSGSSVVSVRAFRKGRARPAQDGKKGDMLVDLSIGVGSGVIFNKNGYIVTNYHVVAQSIRVAIHFSDGRRKYAELVGFDQQNDIAVLKVDIPTPQVAELGRSSDVKTGDLVMAIGTPFGLFENSVTLGIVSAIENNPILPRFQTDASVNYGNSGGALINAKGQVIGISSAKFSLDRNDEIGINFAVQIDIVKEIFDEIIKHGRVVRNWIGISGGTLTRAGHRELNPGVDFGIGLFVDGTEPGSPAEEAGLANKDLITHYDGQLITSPEFFRKLFMATPIGQKVEIQIIREGKPMELQLKLREKPVS